MDKKRSRNMRHGSLLLASLATTCVIATCVPTPPDFSAYVGVNLIPEADLSTIAPSSASPNLGWSPDFDSTGRYMNFERVDLIGFGNYAGAGTAAGELYEGFPDSWRLPDNSLPPVYRLEAKNLIANGDLEAGELTVVETTLTVNYLYNSGAFKNLGTGRYFIVDSENAVTDRFGIDLTNAMVDNDGTTNYERSFSLGFRYALEYTGDLFLTLNANPEDTSVYDEQWNWLRLNNPTLNEIYRFPFTTPLNSKEAILSPRLSPPTNHLWLNPIEQPDNLTDRLKGTFDDFQLLSATDDLAIRYNIPLSSSQRPVLQAGGRYVVKLLVRTDATHTYSLIGTPERNRFKASFVSISLHDLSSSTSLHGKVVVHSLEMDEMVDEMPELNWINHASWDNWTELTAYFSDVVKFDQILTSDYPLQLVISASNMDSSAFRAPGSILIAYPRLYWEANY